MPRPKNKKELITAANTGYEKFLAMIENRESEFTYQEFKCRLIQRETTL